MIFATKRAKNRLAGMVIVVFIPRGSQAIQPPSLHHPHIDFDSYPTSKLTTCSKHHIPPSRNSGGQTIHYHHSGASLRNPFSASSANTGYVCQWWTGLLFSRAERLARMCVRKAAVLGSLDDRFKTQSPAVLPSFLSLSFDTVGDVVGLGLLRFAAS
jgi:hypothetical protein